MVQLTVNQVFITARQKFFTREFEHFMTDLRMYQHIIHWNLPHVSKHICMVHLILSQKKNSIYISKQDTV